MTDSRQIYQIFIAAGPEQVWDAITRPEFTAQYFFGSRIETTGVVGSPLRRVGPGAELWNDDIVIEFDPPRRLVHSWRGLYEPELAAEPASRVTWEIDPLPGGVCKLTVIHDQLESSPNTAASVSGGWMLVISGLKTLLETGRPLSERNTGASPRAAKRDR